MNPGSYHKCMYHFRKTVNFTQHYVILSCQMSSEFTEIFMCKEIFTSRNVKSLIEQQENFPPRDFSSTWEFISDLTEL